MFSFNLKTLLLLLLLEIFFLFDEKVVVHKPVVDGVLVSLPIDFFFLFVQNFFFLFVQNFFFVATIVSFGFERILEGFCAIFVFARNDSGMRFLVSPKPLSTAQLSFAVIKGANKLLMFSLEHFHLFFFFLFFFLEFHLNCIVSKMSLLVLLLGRIRLETFSAIDKRARIQFRKMLVVLKNVTSDFDGWLELGIAMATRKHVFFFRRNKLPTVKMGFFHFAIEHKTFLRIRLVRHDLFCSKVFFKLRKSNAQT